MSGLRGSHGTVTLVHPFLDSSLAQTLFMLSTVFIGSHDWIIQMPTELVAHAKGYLNEETRMISFVKQWPVNQEVQLQFLALPRLFG